jgi:hypothetical protein
MKIGLQVAIAVLLRSEAKRSLISNADNSGIYAIARSSRQSLQNLRSHYSDLNFYYFRSKRDHESITEVSPAEKLEYKRILSTYCRPW